MNQFRYLLLLSLIYSQQMNVIPFDWSGQFGYVNNNGAIMWNQDWESNQLLFDGTWSIYPRMYGPEIENGFGVESNDTTNFDSSLVTSYFKYDQGDYLLDRFSMGSNYTEQKRKIHFHAFKRSYYGNFGQYNNESNQPNQQSYILAYESKKGNDVAGVSMGHFNTYSGIADSSSRGLVNNRITSMNTFWNGSFGNFNSKIVLDQFLQRYQVNHSLSAFNSIRYLTRFRAGGELNWKDLITVGVKKNSRSVRIDSLITIDWTRYYIKNDLSIFNIDMGLTNLNNKTNIDYTVEMKYRIKSFLLNAGIQKDVKPIHPYYLFRNYSENISPISIISNYYSGIEWTGNQTNASLNFVNLLDKNVYWEFVISDTTNYLWQESDHHQLNLNYKTSIIPFVDFEIKYATQNSFNIYGGGIGYFLNYNIKSNLNLFDGFMLVDLKLGVDRYINRLKNSIIHPIEMVPMTVYTRENLDDIALFNGSITAYISTFTIHFEWINITEMVLSSIGSEQNNFFEIHPEMPLMGRQTNFSVEWHFLD